MRKFGVIGMLVLGLIAFSGSSTAAPARAASSGTAAGAQAATTAELATTAKGTKTVAFTGHYSGKVSLLIDNSGTSASAKITSVTGSGTATLVGSSKVKGSGSTKTTAAECPIPFTGTGSITGAKGKITFKVTESKSSACSNGDSGAIKVTFSGVAAATGGTGVASGATGSLKFKGTVNVSGTSGSQSGSYKATLSGTLKVKG